MVASYKDRPSHQPEYRLAYVRKWNRRVRVEAINHYGGKCFCCGEQRLEFLALDPINGGGNQHRKEIRKTCGSLHYWLKKNGWPEGFRVACHNCNSALGFLRVLPASNRAATTVISRRNRAIYLGRITW